ncbi:receptor-like protein kinase FERONIA [Neltuma alba]|uniref:receptor-like protein kinase FERONIA n=1 Tax=Neltuma alba TaxID=207710 RepID=UPI0010A3D8D2|nr:receptor-like protein kinase FERONIA [Prosopis alba]
MPPFLYYTKPDDQQSMRLSGGNMQFPVQNDSALETLYRANAGGRQIPYDKDTGMFRYWDQDNDYLERERSTSISAGFGLDPIYRDDQNYFAPDEVYMTARNYGMKETSKFNVTWEFEVESEFFYMVRLHFCEFDEHIEKAGDRVFQIFINDALVESVADVMLWTKSQRNVPVHRDYAASMQGKGSLKKLNLSIKLQPHPAARSTYRDVLLNGIEIFKISGSNNLRDSNPSSSRRNREKKIRIISLVVGSAVGFILLSLIVLLAYFQLPRAAIKEGNSRWRPKSVPTSEINKSSMLLSDQCRCFSISEVKAATNNFDDSLIIGVGGFGNVYKGQIDNGSVVVAIKRLREGSQQGLKEFQTEIEMLSQLRHRHLVSLIGYSTNRNEMILVYEFMAHGTVRDHLYESDHRPLSWHQRLEICLGAARGLHYLHTGAKNTIIHRDIKSTNILIDENWMAKISDFGLSKIGPSGMTRSNINISTVVKGSIGYLDPEYYMCQRLMEKSDVYSFGVVLLEVLCGRPPIIRAVERQQQNLVEWVRRCVDENKIYETVDPFIKEYTKIALQCLADDGNERPSMGDVMLGLESVMETLNRAKKAELGGALNEEITFDEG